jgi:hypothetical protein
MLLKVSSAITKEFQKANICPTDGFLNTARESNFVQFCPKVSSGLRIPFLIDSVADQHSFIADMDPGKKNSPRIRIHDFANSSKQNTSIRGLLVNMLNPNPHCS